MDFAKRHYVKLARWLSEEVRPRFADPVSYRDAVDALADVLAQDNPRFDRDRLEDAAGVSRSGEG